MSLPQYWSKLCPNINPSTPQPPGSCDNAMTYIGGYHGDGHSPCLLVQGGENDEGATLSDCWIMELHTAEWKKVRHMMTKLNYLFIGYKL